MYLLAHTIPIPIWLLAAVFFIAPMAGFIAGSLLYPLRPVKWRLAILTAYNAIVFAGFATLWWADESLAIVLITLLAMLAGPIVALALMVMAIKADH